MDWEKWKQTNFSAVSYRLTEQEAFLWTSRAKFRDPRVSTIVLAAAQVDPTEGMGELFVMHNSKEVEILRPAIIQSRLQEDLRHFLSTLNVSLQNGKMKHLILGWWDCCGDCMRPCFQQWAISSTFYQEGNGHLEKWALLFVFCCGSSIHAPDLGRLPKFLTLKDLGNQV